MLPPHSRQLQARRHNPSPPSQLLESLRVSRFDAFGQFSEGSALLVSKRSAGHADGTYTLVETEPTSAAEDTWTDVVSRVTAHPIHKDRWRLLETPHPRAPYTGEGVSMRQAPTDPSEPNGGL